MTTRGGGIGGSSKKASTMMMSEGGAKGANIRVTTYNVLSSHLANDVFHVMRSEKSNALVRLERVQKNIG